MELNYKSKKGCPVFEYGILAKFFQKYSMFWGAAFIVLGLVLAFLGKKLLTLMIGIGSALAIFVGGLYLTTMIIDSSMKETEVKDYAVWIILAVWALIGAVGGYFIAKK